MLNEMNRSSYCCSPNPGPAREESAMSLKLGAKVSCHLGMKPEGKAGIQKFSTCSSLEVERGAAGQPGAAFLWAHLHGAPSS